MSVDLHCLLSDVFEIDDLRKVAARIRDGKADDLANRLYEPWAAWAATWVAPPLPEGHLRPFAFNNYSGFDNDGLASAWMNLVAVRDGGDAIEEQIVRHLLFCDGIALPDPFFTSPDGETILPRFYRNQGVVESRDNFAAVVETVDRLKELIKLNILVIVPKYYPMIMEAVFAVGGTAAELFPPYPPGWAAIPRQQVAALDLVAQVEAGAGDLDPYLPTAGHIAVFRELAKAGDEAIRDAIGDAAPSPLNRVLPQVLSCPIPNPVGVTLADIVAIRKQHHFEGWRNAVAAGVERFMQGVEGDPDGWPNSEKALRREISASVKQQMKQETKDIGWIKKPNVEAGVNLVLVGGTAAATAFLAPPVAAAIGMTAALPTLSSVFSRYRFRRGAYARHVAVFA